MQPKIYTRPGIRNLRRIQARSPMDVMLVIQDWENGADALIAADDCDADNAAGMTLAYNCRKWRLELGLPDRR